jgi:hypothetical protein
MQNWGKDSMRRSITAALTAGGLATLAGGCHTMNYTQSTALAGSGLGAVAGAMIGGEGGHAGGALAGAAIGAVAGGLVGNAEDMREERDAAIMQAAYVDQQRAALTNFDVIRLAQGGVGDDVIVGAIASRGGRFDLGPDALIQLRASGVSDRVIIAMQRPAFAAPVEAVIVPPPGPVLMPPPPGPSVEVFVAPRPMYVGPGPRWRHRH